MEVTIQLPEDISAALEAQWDNVPRRSLEAIAIESLHALLKEHHVPLRYTQADVEDDLSAHRELGILPSR